ncbi:MAG: DUF134 domain-containing protein [Spirochaetia bacterium]|nr:DUF134 domain-containing protein [Spirochaetia bacterium]
MPRNKKYRRLGYLSQIKHFAPIKHNEIYNCEMDDVILSNEEFETIRLIDYKGYTQVECSKSMNIARTTVQQLYTDARYKVSLMLLDGRHLFVEGGFYKVFDEISLETEVDNITGNRQRRRRFRNGDSEN